MTTAARVLYVRRAMAATTRTLAHPPELRERWGENLRRKRERCGLTITALADELGVARQTVSNWERGTMAPSYRHRVALAKRYGVRVGRLFPDA